MPILRAGEFGNASKARDSLVIAARISSGVAVRLSDVAEALQSFQDGMMTTSAKLQGDIRLPLTEASKAASECGARSVVLFAGVPHVADA